MAGEIIAERFALLKTRGGNGVAFTHLVEDTVKGCRAVVKVSDRLGALGLEYLKTVNLLAESGARGILMPLEGGLLEEDGEYYLAFPEVGEPSLEDYLRMRPALDIWEIMEIFDQVLFILDEMHRAGFLHLFLDPRNVFYLPRRSVTLKDPALKAEFFHLFLELVSAPDFSFLHPALMDGGMPGRGADLYAAGRLGERLLGALGGVGAPGVSREAAGYGGAPLAEWAALEEVIAACRGVDVEGSGITAGDLRRGLREVLEAKMGRGRRDYLPVPGTPEAVDSADSGSIRDGEPGFEDGGSGLEGELEGGGRDVIWASGEAFPDPGGLAPHEKTPGERWKGVCALSLLFILWTALASWHVLPGRARAGRSTASAASAGAGGSEAGAEEEALHLLSTDMAEAVREAFRPDGAGAPAPTETSFGNDEPSAAAPAAADGRSPGNGEESASLSGGAAEKRSPAPPVASFTVSPAEGESPLRVLLDASASYDPDGMIVSYTWSFGGSGKVVYHVLESNLIPASVEITLTVTDDGGHAATCTRRVVLY